MLDVLIHCGMIGWIGWMPILGHTVYIGQSYFSKKRLVAIQTWPHLKDDWFTFSVYGRSCVHWTYL